MITVAMVNRAPGVISDHHASVTVPAFQTFYDRDFCPSWGLDPCKLIYVAAHEKVPAGVWPLYLLRTSDVPGAGGYHEDTGPVPDGKVFVGDAFQYGISWTVDFSHEFAEMMADPGTDRWTPAPGMPGWEVIVEPGDPVEADEFGYKITNVLVTDFTMPAYYGFSSDLTYDFQKHLTKPCPGLLPGGYVSFMDAEGNIKQLTARKIDGSMGRRSSRVGRVYRK